MAGAHGDGVGSHSGSWEAKRKTGKSWGPNIPLKGMFLLKGLRKNGFET
jgi:hypothetical protein